MPCFHFRNHTRNNPLIRKHVTYLIKKYLNVRSIYYNNSFFIEKIFWNLSSLLHSLTYLSLLYLFLLLVLSTFPVFLKSFNNYFFRWLAYKSLLAKVYPVDTRRLFSVYKTSIRRLWRCIDVLQTLKRRRVSTGWCCNKLYYVDFQSFYVGSSCFQRFSWARLLRVLIFLGQGPGSRSKVWVQVLKVDDAKQFYWNHISAWVFSAACFQNCFS